MSVAVTTLTWSTLHKQTKEAMPNETGGLVVQYQQGGLCQQVPFAIPNVHHEPAANYAGAASETIAAYDFAADYVDLGGAIAFEWHSHPTTAAIPSPTDKAVMHPSRVLCIVPGNGDFGDMKMWDTSTWEEVLWVNVV